MLAEMLLGCWWWLLYDCMLTDTAIFGLSCCIYLASAQKRVGSVSDPVDAGGLGQWTAWSGCSTSCEELLGSRSRSCQSTDNSFRNQSQNVKTCSGVRKQYKLCDKTKKCNAVGNEIRRTECDRQIHVPFRGRRYHWIPLINKESPCEVSCKSSRYGFYTGFGRLVKDGVPCSNTVDDRICLHGRCQVVGCDGVVGSGLKKDHCGVCGGDNDSCRIIAGIYTRRNLKYGYNQITRIPAGSCHVNITELARSRNYLVLKYSNGTGVINSERAMMKRPGQYLAAGTIFHYNKYSGNQCPGECLYGQGPLNVDIDIQLLTYRRNPGIKYMFTIPNDKLDSVMKSLSPTTNALTRHDGRHRGNSQPSAVGSRNNNIRGSRRKLSYNEQPEFVSPDNGGARSGSYQALQSGLHSTQDAINRYRQGYGHHGDEGVNDIAESSRNNLPHVNSVQTEARHQPNSIPQSGSRAPDYARGISNHNYDRNQLRAGFRYQPYYGNGIESRRQELIVPDTLDEVNFHWTISGFSECSASCGGGHQDTNVVCMKRKTNVIVTDENCDPSKKHVQTIICNRSPCPPDWEPAPWSVCSKTCGDGVQTRRVECQQRYSGNYTVPISARLCNLVAKPETSRSCQVKPCADWRASNWTKCSVECGIGQVSRTVDCANTEGEVVAERECAAVKPVIIKSCDMGTCAKGWFQTGWSKECSSECGRGYHTRTVYCSAEDGSPLPEHKCGEKPRTKKSCKKNRPCGGFWFEGPWTQCTATCGTEVQTRDVVCLKKLEKKMFAVVGEVNCKGHPKPKTQRQCPKLPDCPAEWFMTKWSQCTKSCGTGIKTRDVKCLEADMTPNSQCGKEDKPSLRRTCNTQDCDLPQLDEDPSCKDLWPQCRLVVQARLCTYYNEKCCHSCTLHHLKHKKEKLQQQQEVGQQEVQ